MLECDNCGIVLRNENAAEMFAEEMKGKEHMFEMVGFEKWVEGIRQGKVTTMECFECDDGILS